MNNDPCLWPNGTCKCYLENETKPDLYGRVWMHCDEGLNFSKASMSRFIMFCLANNVKIGDIFVMNNKYPQSAVSVSIRLKESQFEDFTAETKGILKRPPEISLN